MWTRHDPAKTIGWGGKGAKEMPSLHMNFQTNYPHLFLTSLYFSIVSPCFVDILC